MCDDLTNADNEQLIKGMSRREFGAAAGAAGLMALLPTLRMRWASSRRT